MIRMLVLVCVLVAGIGCRAGGTDDPALLPGVWLSSRYSIEIFEDLTYRAAGAPNLQVIEVYGVMEAEEGVLTMQDQDGLLACPPEQEGVYGFAVDDATLRLYLYSDPCTGRRTALNAAVLQRQQ